MSNVQAQISQRIQAFAMELEELVRHAAIEAVAVSLGGGSARRAATAPSRVAGPAKAAAPRKGKSGGKRPPAELAAAVIRTAEWVKGNAGHGVEDMARALGVPTKELALPIMKLLKAKTIKKRGQKRATKYYPG